MPFSGENAESYYDDGLTASMKGDWARAARCFEKAIQLDAKFLAAYHQLARCYLREGQGQRAVHLLQQVVERKPDLAPPRLDLGYALISIGRVEEARQQFERLVAVDPGNGRAFLGLAKVSFEEGDWPTAMARARAALDRSGPSFGVLFLLGRAAKLTGDSAVADASLERADALIEKSLELQSDQPEGYYLRGEVCFVRAKYADALEQYRAAEVRAERTGCYGAFGEAFTFVDILAKQGLCFQKLGKPDRAREMGRQIVEIDPEHALGKALSELE
ncbi:MAG: tetratricopeptide repeat protein [Candidatus Hydrogenedentes bacterium]|nr:tetratricopeptide repeat protein [Candidatus Hydrogenedentota bacterium]